jgi:low affinity Fe/Cu permease
LEAPIDWRDIWPWILGVLITSIIIYIIRKYLFNNKEKTKKIEPKIIIPPYIIALDQLTELENAKIWQAGRIKEYHSKISEIIRRYTENRFDFIALELATDEIISQLKNKLDNQQLSSINTLLQRADLAKFAKSKPSDDENNESMQLAKDFINETKAKINNG